MRMLFPHPADSVDPAVVYADMPNADGRPSVRLNMIVSVDGGTSWNGVSGALGGPADKALFATLRSLADVDPRGIGHDARRAIRAGGHARRRAARAPIPRAATGSRRRGRVEQLPIRLAVAVLQRGDDHAVHHHGGSRPTRGHANEPPKSPKSSSRATTPSTSPARLVSSERAEPPTSSPKAVRP